ncbi:MAG: PLxRFG domain-containing protein, partial [Betaproteobacteria bacterium]|nr:PLxRFG domain-containing protein [Betaproteobacteria bacterium]
QVKKDTVMKFTASEYDAHIAQLDNLINGGTLDDKALKDAKAELAQVKKDKKSDLAKFARLFAIQEGKPYAPIKRFGPYAVVAKSQEYVDAVAANDTKKVRELEQSEDHYHVSFTETAAEAEALANELEDQGNYNQVQHFERSVSEDGLYGDQSMMTALTNLRSRINASDRPGTRQLQQLVTEMWLQNLAESSARKSEMRRRGVAGEVDMLRSFTSQGRADANFLAATQYGSQIQDAMQDVHKQARQSKDRTRASEVLNELDRRYQQTFERTSNPWLDKLRRMSSVYFLATSPAYYIQNLTQPWMMSVPAMTGAHGWGEIHAELTKAYAEMKQVVKSGGLLNQMFDYNSVPGDVRSAIQELVNRGKIDIGMDTELGQFRVEGEGVVKDKINKVDKGLRLAIQKVEAINRLSTAMTAYRLERGKGRSHEQALEYADRILTETHGDYTAFNAPRAFNTQLGKVALQFRKFQLLQVGYYAKLINDIFTSPKDRAAAMKMLGFSL